MHVVSLGLAPVVLLVTRHEAAGDRIVLLELVVASGLVITQHRGNGQILRTGIEDDLGRLALRGTHVHGTEVDGVVPAVEGHLQLQVILLVDVSVGNFTDQLSDVLLRGNSLVNFSLQIVLVVNIVRKLLQGSGVGLTVPLSELDITIVDQVKSILAALELTQLRVVHRIRVQHDLLSLIGNTRARDNQALVRRRLQLQIVDCLDFLALQVDSEDALAGRCVESLGLKGGEQEEAKFDHFLGHNGLLRNNYL